MDHTGHRPGPVKDCSECRSFAYEPTWYAALIAFDLTVASGSRAA
jgi:hypothetical protein